MPSTIRQSLFFAEKPSKLYAAFLDSAAHSDFTGCPTRISAKPGAAFRAMDYITGKNLQLVRGKQIVQSWRGDDWKASDPDSLFILNFGAEKNGTRLEMIHAGVPDRHKKSLASGWHEHYWRPLKAWLAR